MLKPDGRVLTLVALSVIASWRGDGSLRGWLIRIATNRAFRVVSAKARSVSLDAGVGGWHGGVTETEPLDDLLSAERQRLVQAAVAALPEPYRETIALRYFGELSLAEIARTTGRPIGTVKTHVGRGLLRLRAVLAEVRAA